MTDYSAIIETGLNTYISAAGLESKLYDSVKYSLMNAGKRIRPYICLLVAEMLGQCVEKALPFACAIEMIHTYSLIHDDLPAMDNDDMRRGMPSNHVVYGEGNAILAGDALLTLASRILSEADNALASGSVMTGALEMVNGQSLDINESDRNDDTLKKMYNGKTGGLFYAAILSAYYVSGGTEKGASEWKKFALDLGMLFQITDDLLDMEKDKSENKFTYLTLHSSEETRLYINRLVKSLLEHVSVYQNAQAERLRELIRLLPERKK